MGGQVRSTIGSGSLWRDVIILKCSMCWSMIALLRGAHLARAPMTERFTDDLSPKQVWAPTRQPAATTVLFPNDTVGCIALVVPTSASNDPVHGADSAYILGADSTDSILGALHTCTTTLLLSGCKGIDVCAESRQHTYSSPPSVAHVKRWRSNKHAPVISRFAISRLTSSRLCNVLTRLQSWCPSAMYAPQNMLSEGAACAKALLRKPGHAPAR